jgi:hypothetical protein
MQAYTGCIAGALTRAQFTAELHAARLTEITIDETHRVHQAAASAIIRATKPSAGCCSTRRLFHNPERPRLIVIPVQVADSVSSHFGRVAIDLAVWSAPIRPAKSAVVNFVQLL